MLLGRLRTHRNRSAQITYRRDNRHVIKALNPPDVKQVMKTGNNIRHHHQRCAAASQQSPAGTQQRTLHRSKVRSSYCKHTCWSLFLNGGKLARLQSQHHFSQQQCRGSSEASGVGDFRGKTSTRLNIFDFSTTGSALVRCDAAFMASNVAQMSMRRNLVVRCDRRLHKSLFEESKCHKTTDVPVFTELHFCSRTPEVLLKIAPSKLHNNSKKWNDS